MKLLPVFGIVGCIHLGVLGALLVQPGCQSSSTPPPDPAMTQAQGRSQPMAPPSRGAANSVESDFNSALTPVAGVQRGLSEPMRPPRQRMDRPDRDSMEPVLEPVTQAVQVNLAERMVNVQPGDTLSAIARREGVSLDALLAANGLTKSSVIYAGQSLLVPAEPEPSSPVVAPSANRTGLYVVQRGDTLSKIAVLKGTTVAHLRQLNQISGDRILVGQTLTVPASASSPEPSESSQSRRGPTYVIQSGDTLSGIANRFGVSVRSLMDANGIGDPRRILVGQTLSIPGGSPRGGAGNSRQASSVSGDSGQRTSPSSSSPTVSSPTFQREEAAGGLSTPQRPAADGVISAEETLDILEALEDEDLPYVEVEDVSGGG